MSVSLFYLCPLVCCLFYFCFFFKQKTAYEMRISDWSSDVCSSDLNCSSICPVAHLLQLLSRRLFWQEARAPQRQRIHLQGTQHRPDRSVHRSHSQAVHDQIRRGERSETWQQCRRS